MTTYDEMIEILLDYYFNNEPGGMKNGCTEE
jgi:hypothetical protein